MLGGDKIITGISYWLEKPLRPFWRVASWVTSSALFYGIMLLLGGPSTGDSQQSIYPTWALAHAKFACTYSPVPGLRAQLLFKPTVYMAPLYPIFSGALAWVLRVGHSMAFPTTTQLGPHCSHADVAFFQWAWTSGSFIPTLRLSYFVWPVLAIAAVYLLSTAQRSRRNYEVLALFMLAVTPTIYMCLNYVFHPEDILALAIILLSTAFALKNKWLLAGVAMGLACATQQYAFLAAIPLLIVVPNRNRLRLFIGAVISTAIIDVPLILVTHGRALRPIIIGSSLSGATSRSHGGTLLYATGLHGSLLFIISRLCPIYAAAFLAFYLIKRFGPALLTPIPLVSLIIAALTIRLVFEENIISYYFLAASIGLVLLDMLRGRLRGTTLAWIGLLVITFDPITPMEALQPTGHTSIMYYAIPAIVLALTALCVLYDAIRHHVHIYKVLLLLASGLACLSNILGYRYELFNAPQWLWQVILVPLALVLILRPLLSQKDPPLEQPTDPQPTIPAAVAIGPVASS